MAALDHETANISVPPPQSSFSGRLNMENFRFKTEPQSPQAGGSRKRKAAVTADDNARVPALPDGSTEAEAATADSSSPSSTPTPGSTKKPKKRNRPKSGYQPPGVYAHLPPLPDALAPNLLALFCGLNPGVRTAQTGHAYNHPSNLFWKLMYSSGVLPVRCSAEEDRTLPARFSLGLTNIVSRPSRNGAELSKAEMDAGVGDLEAKAAVAARGGGGRREEHLGDEGENMGVGDVSDEEREDGVEYRDGWMGARVFVSSSTSGLAATLSPAEKERIWRELGRWVEARRAGKDMAPGLVDDVS
ncbi:hypothetical protein INS49_002701 [Diaporthe citri]|uniref:uncharacterized protein n=1 Tax=Diaporthe citri TaxID=83186 RepID=UPI001C8110B8|nr:uncharacterized protein INS49_002701 [Diaporthe citri]KAG6368492.1 hypothetical protein INS49_002701 [Diaporthe citri]